MKDNDFQSSIKLPDICSNVFYFVLAFVRCWGSYIAQNKWQFCRKLVGNKYRVRGHYQQRRVDNETSSIERPEPSETTKWQNFCLLSLTWFNTWIFSLIIVFNHRLKYRHVMRRIFIAGTIQFISLYLPIRGPQQEVCT